MTGITRASCATLAVMCMLPCLSIGQTAPVTVTYAYNGLPIAILNDSADVISVANIVVPRALKITKVTARVQIQYPNTGDLNIYLFSPQGTRTILLEHDCSVANVDTTFDDAAPSPWKEFCPTEAGRGPFRPDQPLSNFNSDNSSFGTWRLAMENNQSDSRSGWMTEFSLTITGTTQLNPITNTQAIVNAASLGGAGTIAPGEIVSIYGNGVGPATPVSAGIGALPTTLGGVTVTFNATPAPIAYVSAYRLDVQVPNSLTPGSTANLQVTSGTLQSTGTVTLNVTDAVPGTYTKSVIGSGAISASNQDGTPNSTLAPAAKGSVIAVYASGLGALNPPLADGAVPPANPLSRVTGTIGAFIGGIPATVQYAGAAPGHPGLYQVNILVPTTVGSGTQDVVLYLNGKASQTGTTIQVR